MNATEMAQDIIDNADEWGWDLDSTQDKFDASYSYVRALNEDENPNNICHVAVAEVLEDVVNR